MKRNRIVITSGEPAGIGPDLIISLNNHLKNIAGEILVLADIELLKDRAHQLNSKLFFNQVSENSLSHTLPDTSINVFHIPCKEQCVAGQLNVENSAYVIAQLDKAIELCTAGVCDAMVTCPIQKSILIEAGYNIIGHTEYLAEKTKVPKVVMLLVNEHLRVALATTHIPLNEVSAALNQQDLIEILEVIDQDLQLKFAIEAPRIFVAGLNPHAGENGHLGNEELTIIEPALAQLREQGLDIVGPLSADTLFTLENRKQADVFLAMFHDQGLPVLKALGFGDSVNITLGLPIIRTSVDHGTALSLAATGKADNRSLLQAIAYAFELARNSQDA